MGFLDSYRIVDFTDERGLLAGRMLADLGADVIQVEPLAGSSARRVGPFDPDGESLYWQAYAANKRGVSCDLDRPEGRDAARRLCAEADFVFESESPGVMAGRGLGYDDIRALNPRVIYTSITPFGSDGPKASYADTELILWAAGGPLHAHRDGDKPPVRISVPQAYLHGAADAAGGALVAHFARRQSGLGQHVDVAVIESVTQATLSRTLATAVGDPQGSKMIADEAKVAVGKVDQSGSGSGTAQTKWPTLDGFVELHLAMGPAAGQFTNNFFAWLHDEGACDDRLAAVDWCTAPALLAAGELTLDEVARARSVTGAFLARRTKQEVMEASLTRKLLGAPVYTVRDLAESPHLVERHFWVEVGDAERRRVLPGPFARTAVDAFSVRRRAPRLGEHNAEVLGEVLGLTA